MKPGSVAAAAKVVGAILFGVVMLALTSQRDEARAQATYAKSRQAEAEGYVLIWRDMAEANREANAANRERAESCERLMKMSEVKP